MPDPTPGPGDVLIRVGAAALNNTDIWTREGACRSARDPDAVVDWGRAPELPRIQGADVVGEVVGVGPGVPGSRLGERVLVNPVLTARADRWPAAGRYLGRDLDGGFAELCVVPAENAVPVVSPLSDAKLATFPSAYLAAAHMLSRARLVAGETVLVTGASGGVGLALVNLAAARGAVVVAMVARRRPPRACQFGAISVVARDALDLEGGVTGALQGRPLDVVLDVVGGNTLAARVLATLRPGGRYVAAPSHGRTRLDLGTVCRKGIEVIGANFGTPDDFRVVVDRLAGRSLLKPLLAGAYPLDELPRAQAALRQGGVAGKLVIVPQPRA